MKCLLLMYSTPAETMALLPSDLELIARKHATLRSELGQSGELISGVGLAYPAETRTIRLTPGGAVASDGPLHAAELQLTAYYLVDCPDIGRVLTISERILDYHVTAIEVRAVHDSFG